MVNIYLDLNIFDRLEKINKLELSEKANYQILLDLIIGGQVQVPYSNAHLNDLFRGFQKNPAFVEALLESIEKLSNNLCICQYWNEAKVRWHTRDIKEFFDQKKTIGNLKLKLFQNFFRMNH